MALKWLDGAKRKFCVCQKENLILHECLYLFRIAIKDENRHTEMTHEFGKNFTQKMNFLKWVIFLPSFTFHFKFFGFATVLFFLFCLFVPHWKFIRFSTFVQTTIRSSLKEKTSKTERNLAILKNTLKAILMKKADSFGNLLQLG